MAEATKTSVTTVGALVFFQMLPATMLTPAIRPLFAEAHGGDERMMHAFMALNMVGAAIAVPRLGRWFDARPRPAGALVGLLLLDALLLGTMPLLATRALLAARLCEGAVHVGVTSVLMARAAALGRIHGNGRAMGAAGAALMFAVAFGSTLGGLLVAHGSALPFFGAAALLVALALALMTSFGAPRPHDATATGAPPRPGAALTSRLAVVIGAVFVGRFTVGCIVVTFALFAHKHHGLSDRSVGLLFSAMTLPFALAMYPVGKLMDRRTAAPIMLLGAVAYGGGLISIGYVPTAGLPWLMAACGIASACLFAPCLCYGALLADGDRTASMSVINAAGCTGMIVGPAIAGGLVGSMGSSVDTYRIIFLVAGSSLFAWSALSVPWVRMRIDLDRARLARLQHGAHAA